MRHIWKMWTCQSFHCYFFSTKNAGNSHYFCTTELSYGKNFYLNSFHDSSAVRCYQASAKIVKIAKKILSPFVTITFVATMRESYGEISSWHCGLPKKKLWEEYHTPDLPLRISMISLNASLKVSFGRKSRFDQTEDRGLNVMKNRTHCSWLLSSLSTETEFGLLYRSLSKSVIFIMFSTLCN